MELGPATAFLGGLLTFASPCVLPLVPIYLSVLVGGDLHAVSGLRSRFRLLGNGLMFVLGFLAVFAALGMAASALGRFLIVHRLVFQQVGGLLVFFFGLKFLGLVNGTFLDREKRLQIGGKGPITPLSAALIGFTFAFGWTPCIGPILGSILTFTAVSTNSPATGAWYLFLYGAGVGLPLLLVALLAQSGAKLLQRVSTFLPRLERVTGFVLVALAVLMVTDSLGVLTIASSSKSSSEIALSLSASGSTPDVGRTSHAGVPTSASSEAGSAAAVPEQCEATSGCGLGGAEEFPGAAPPQATIDLRRLTRGPVLLDFHRPDCPACLRMVPILQALGRSCSGRGLRIETIDVSIPENRLLAQQMAVVGTPTLAFFDEEGREVTRLVGAQEIDTVERAMGILMGEQCAEFSRL
ncbi:MAG: cytochrome c biogenesis protein/thioredoxin [Deltaproteobacteria bacterium]|nr:cytochrome c biogenesis protein/thioredoxin [Deltaproteobacteria bacterium]